MVAGWGGDREVANRVYEGATRRQASGAHLQDMGCNLCLKQPERNLMASQPEHRSAPAPCYY